MPFINKTNQRTLKIMTYQEAESFLFTELLSFQDKGRVAFNGTPDNAIALSEILDNPQKKFKSIHVGGTNGKGSVSHIIAAGLQANGYKVGLYTSPHYKSYRERMKINGVLIEESDIVHFIQTYKNDILNIKPSFFEITCAMAFDYFANNEVDVAIIEVGLGGRLDSTNIIQPLVSVITNISFDHQDILGNTLEEIAEEKAGIFKANTLAIIGEKQKETSNVYRIKAKESDAHLLYAEDNSKLIYQNKNNKNNFIFKINSDGWNVRFESHHINSFQIKNLKTALYTLYQLKDQFELDPNKIAKGIKNINTLTYFIGRWSTIRQNPTVIFDSAHNTMGVKYLVKQVEKMRYEKLRIVWGTTKEKDIDQILSLLPKNAIYYYCRAQNSRAMDADKLMDKAKDYELVGYSYRTVKAAYQVALVEANQEDLIIVAGSSFVVAEVI